MSIEAQISEYIASQPKPKQTELQQLHDLITSVEPGCKLWFIDGRNDEGKVVSNPSIGYGSRPHKYADGSVRDFYQIGLSANRSGISVYILGIDDKALLADKYGKDLGKATVTGYCIRFRKLEDIDTTVLAEAVRSGLNETKRK